MSYNRNSNHIFKPYSPNSLGNNKFSSVFANYPSIITPMDSHNYGLNLLHNNVNRETENVHITEYTIHIDSKDRNYSSFPNPFEYTVSFGESASSIIPVEVRNPSGGGYIIQNNTVNGARAPYINVRIKNVSYIIFESVILPLYNRIIYNGSGTGSKENYSFSTSGTDIIYNDRFTNLEITELQPLNLYATNTLSEKCVEVFPDNIYGQQYFLGQVRNGKIVYDVDCLKTLDRLHISFKNSFGTPLLYDYINNSCGTILSDYTDLRNPLCYYTQNTVSLIVGVYEDDINKKIF